MNTAKTIDLTRLCTQINNTVVFSNHTHIKLKKKTNTKNMAKVNRKYWVTPCFVSHDFGLRTFIVEQSSIFRHQNCFFLINWQCLLVYFKKLFDIYVAVCIRIMQNKQKVIHDPSQNPSIFYHKIKQIRIIQFIIFFLQKKNTWLIFNY